MEFNTRFFDGRSIQPHLAQVEITRWGLDIHINQERLLWPFIELLVLEQPIENREAVLGCRLLPGARLIIPNIAIYNDLLPLISRRNIKHSHVSHTWRNLLLLLLSSLGFVAALLVGLHFFAPWIAKNIPYSWDNKLGQFVVDQIADTPMECVYQPGVVALNKLTYILTTNLVASENPFDIKVIPFSKHQVNAFAVPGHHIVIMDGLLAYSDSPDELAGVLAHEMGHAIEHHPTQSVIRQLGTTIILSTLFGSSYNFGSLLINAKYSRENENQADAIAVKLLNGVGIGKAGLLQFFTKMHQKEEAHSFFAEEYLENHPALSSRIKHIQELPSIPKTHPPLTWQEWQDLKNICKEKRPIQWKN